MDNNGNDFDNTPPAVASTTIYGAPGLHETPLGLLSIPAGGYASVSANELGILLATGKFTLEAPGEKSPVSAEEAPASTQASNEDIADAPPAEEPAPAAEADGADAESPAGPESSEEPEVGLEASGGFVEHEVDNTDVADQDLGEAAPDASAPESAGVPDATEKRGPGRPKKNG